MCKSNYLRAKYFWKIKVTRHKAVNQANELTSIYDTGTISGNRSEFTETTTTMSMQGFMSKPSALHPRLLI